MDYFSIGLNIFCLIAQGIMHICFCTSLTGKEQRAYHFAIYIFISCILDWTANKFSFPWVIVIGIELLILYGVNRFIRVCKIICVNHHRLFETSIFV